MRHKESRGEPSVGRTEVSVQRVWTVECSKSSPRVKKHSDQTDFIFEFRGCYNLVVRSGSVPNLVFHSTYLVGRPLGLFH